MWKVLVPSAYDIAKLVSRSSTMFEASSISVMRSAPSFVGSGLIGIPKRVNISAGSGSSKGGSETADSGSESAQLGWEVTYLMNLAIGVNSYIHISSEAVNGSFSQMMTRHPSPGFTGYAITASCPPACGKTTGTFTIDGYLRRFPFFIAVDPSGFTVAIQQ